MVGDRCWAVYTADGKLGSGKNTRRFRRVPGLLDLSARLHTERDTEPLLRFPDGSQRPAGDDDTSAALTDLLGQPLQLRPEKSVTHHDQCPVHVVTTAAIGHLQQLTGEPVDAARFRSNVVLDVDDADGTGFVEDDWIGREIALGCEVVLRLGPPMTRCVMIDMPQPGIGLHRGAQLLEPLGRVHEANFGLQASVVRPGTVRLGDVATLPR